MCFVDDYSRFTWTHPLKNKFDVFEQFCLFQTLVENLFNTKIKYFQSDGGQELDNKPLLFHFASCGISFRKSCPDTQQQNGVAERKHCHFIELARMMLIELSINFHLLL